MIAYAAIDLRGGRVVQLVGGRPDQERVSLPDAGAVARDWIACGFTALHIVDLDAALGTGDNCAVIDAVVAAAPGVHVQVGGGVRTTARAAELLARGVARVVVGTRAVEDRAWLEEIAARWPDRIIVAADVDDRHVVVRGWTASAGIAAEAFLEQLERIPLAAALVTDVTREGRMTGVDTDRFRRFSDACAHPLIASGGVADTADLHALAGAGVAGAVLGMALYTGALDAHAVAREFAA